MEPDCLCGSYPDVRLENGPGCLCDNYSNSRNKSVECAIEIPHDGLDHCMPCCTNGSCTIDGQYIILPIIARILQPNGETFVTVIHQNVFIPFSVIRCGASLAEILEYVKRCLVRCSSPTVSYEYMSVRQAYYFPRCHYPSYSPQFCNPCTSNATKGDKVTLATQVSRCACDIPESRTPSLVRIKEEDKKADQPKKKTKKK